MLHPVVLPLTGARAGAAFDTLVLDRDAVLGGQLWRLWSAHWVHLDPHHAAINLAALALLAAIAAYMRQLGAVLRSSLLLMPLLALGLLACVPTLQWYAGLSGLLHGWAAWLLMRHGGWLAAAGAVLLAGKLAWELLVPGHGDAPFPVIHEAHLIGAIIGAALALPATLHRRRTLMR